MNLEYLQTFNYNIDNFLKITTIIIISIFFNRFSSYSIILSKTN